MYFQDHPTGFICSIFKQKYEQSPRAEEPQEEMSRLHFHPKHHDSAKHNICHLIPVNRQTSQDGACAYGSLIRKISTTTLLPKVTGTITFVM